MPDEITPREQRWSRAFYWIAGGFVLMFAWYLVMIVNDMRTIRGYSAHHCGWHEGRGDPNACKPVTVPEGSE